jgi:hypothetical protein
MRMTTMMERDSPSFSLRLQKGEDVVEPDGTLDVSDDGSVGLVHELDSDLGDTSSGTGSAKDLGDQYVFNQARSWALTRAWDQLGDA